MMATKQTVSFVFFGIALIFGANAMDSDRSGKKGSTVSPDRNSTAEGPTEKGRKKSVPGGGYGPGADARKARKAMALANAEFVRRGFLAPAKPPNGSNTLPQSNETAAGALQELHAQSKADTQLADEDTPPSPAPLAKSQDTTGTGLVEIKAVDLKDTTGTGLVEIKAVRPQADLSIYPTPREWTQDEDVQLAHQNAAEEEKALVKPASNSSKSTNPHRGMFQLIGGMQTGGDRGAFIGANAADPHHDWVTFTGWTPLLYKTDDFMEVDSISQETVPKLPRLPVNHLPREWAQPHGVWRKKLVDKEGEKWLQQEKITYKRVHGLMRRFNLKQFLTLDAKKKPKLSFPPKDRANAAMAHVVVGFRMDIKDKGAGVEQTVNFALFGKYGFVEQYAQGKLLGGAAQRARLLPLLSDRGQGVAQNLICGKDPLGLPTCIRFRQNTDYQVMDFVKQPQEPKDLEAKKKDNKKTGEKGDRNDKEKKIASEIADQVKENIKPENIDKENIKPENIAKRSAIIFTLGLTVPGQGLSESDQAVGCKLAQFLDDHSTPHEVLRVMVTGGSEVECKCQSRISKIFEIALTKRNCQVDSLGSVAETEPDPKEAGRSSAEGLAAAARVMRAAMAKANKAKDSLSRLLSPKAAHEEAAAKAAHEEAAAKERAYEQEIQDIPCANEKEQRSWNEKIATIKKQEKEEAMKTRAK